MDTLAVQWGGLRTWEEMGWWGPLGMLVTGVSLMASLGALVLRGWKPQLPAAVFLALGLTPWLVGTFGTRWGVRECFEAIANVNPFDKATILLNGFSEALSSYLFGGGLSVALLLGLAAGLGTAALVVASGRRASEGPSFEPGGPASAALLCLAAALAVGALLPSAFIHRNGFLALANVNPLDRETLLVQTVTSLGPAQQFSRVALGVALALTVGTALWAQRRSGTGLEGALAPALRESLSEWQLEAAEVEDMLERRRLILPPTLTLAVDGRFDGAKLRVLVEAAMKARVRSLILVGQAPSTPSSALLETQPLMGSFAREVLATEPIALLSALPQGQPMQGGWDAHLDANVLTLTPRPGSSEEPLTVDLSQLPPEVESVYDGSRVVPVYLPVGEALTAERLVRVSEALSRRSTERRLLPVLLTERLSEDAAPMADDGSR